MATSTIPFGDKIHVMQITATTGASGQINLSSYLSGRNIVNVVSVTSGKYYMAFLLRYNASTYWAMVYQWPAMSVVASESVTLNIYYQ